MRRLLLLLTLLCDELQIGETLSAPLDVVITRNPLETRQPDLLVISAERMIANGDDAKIIEVAPELIIEVLSDSDTKQVLDDNLADYAQIGVEECWLVAPEAETIEVLQLVGGEYLRVVLHESGAVISSCVVPKLQLPASAVFVG